MATVVMAKEFQHDLKLDGSLKSKAWDLMRKLSAEENLGGLDLKRPKTAVDERVRTARVNDNYRAVLFYAGNSGDPIYLLVAIKPHDPAYEHATSITSGPDMEPVRTAAEYAAGLKMRVNPMNGVFEVLHDDALNEAREQTRHRAEQVPDDRPLLVPHDPSVLVNLGIHESIAEQVVQLRDEDKLQEVCVRAPAWQGKALLDLAVGISPDEVRERYAATASGEPSGHLNEQASGDILESLRLTGSRMDFVVFTDDEHMRHILDGDLDDWRVFLHPEQRWLARHRGWKGSFRVTGGAGTGKTVVALHRAVHLAGRAEQPRVLVTTFNRSLADQLNRQLSQLADPETRKQITVKGVDQLARDVWSRAMGNSRTRVAPDEQRYWVSARDSLDLDARDIELMHPHFLDREYQQVILGNTVRNKEEYLNVSRRGRRTRLNRIQRARIWSVVEEFERQLELHDQITWGQIAAKAADIAGQGEMLDVNRYDHAVVDEGQDFTPSHWRLLRGLVPKGPEDLFLCEDGHQRIYGERVTLSHFDIETRGGRSRKLTLNYRTTRQVLGLAMGVLGEERFVDLEDEQENTEGYRSLLRGPEPARRGFSADSEEREFIVKTISEWIASDSRNAGIAVLSHSGKLRRNLVDDLRAANISANLVDGNNSDTTGVDTVQVATLHHAKGAEYRRVIIAGANDRDIPNSYMLDKSAPEERPGVVQQQRCLFYVACTRAREELVISWSGNPTPFLPPEKPSQEM